jgi:hypothetical protein
MGTSYLLELETMFLGLIIGLNKTGEKTMLKKNALVILLLFLVAGCTACKGVKTAQGGDEPPVILDSYAAESVRPGATWRVYRFYLHQRSRAGRFCRVSHFNYPSRLLAAAGIRRSDAYHPGLRRKQE